MKFSVAMAVYSGDNPHHFALALASVFNQTAQPNEVALVVDGPVSQETEKIIAHFLAQENTLKVVRLERNMGHGTARRVGLEHCANELVALMDADDISHKDRFSEQLKCFEKMPDLAVVGGLIAEFEQNINQPTNIRRVPESDGDIKRYLKQRCPFNQVSVMVKKEQVIKAGGYIDFYHNEDYYLWVRMTLIGAKFYNLQKVLVSVRADEAMYRRRGGYAYFASEVRLQKYMLDKGLISPLRFFANVAIRFLVQMLLPNKMRELFFRKFARERVV